MYGLEADSEAGRREPKSLLSATAEELDKIAAGTSQAVTQGAAGAKQALSRTWQELSTNQELHKGIEFGVKAAGEVSKDVWKRAGEDGLAASTDLLWQGNPATAKLSDLLGPAAGLARGGLRDYEEFPGWARDMGTRIRAIQTKVYSKQ